MEPVLLVEDKAELRAMLRKFLERAGYSVDEAPDGKCRHRKSSRPPLPLRNFRSETPRQFRNRRVARSAQGRRAAPRHSGHRLWLGRRSRHCHEGRRLRFHPEARRSRSPQNSYRPWRQTAGTTPRKSASSRGILRPLRLPAHRRRGSLHAGSESKSLSESPPPTPPFCFSAKAAPAKNSSPAPCITSARAASSLSSR